MSAKRDDRVHFVAHCDDCDWETSDFLRGPEAALSHAKSKRHKVVGESGYYHGYDFRPATPAPGGKE